MNKVMLVIGILMKILVFFVLVSWITGCATSRYTKTCYQPSGRGGQQFEVRCE